MYKLNKMLFNRWLCLKFIVSLLLIINGGICDQSTLNNKASLLIYSVGVQGLSDVAIRNRNESFEVICEYRNENNIQMPWTDIVWSYSPPFENMSIELVGTRHTDGGSRLFIDELSSNHTGHYMCSTDMQTATKYLYVQNTTSSCMTGALMCDVCIPPRFVCDGFSDCNDSQDESEIVCGTAQPCRDKLNCSNNRCIPEFECCDQLHPLCMQPECCYARLYTDPYRGYFEREVVNQLEDNRHLEDYGFIQTTIYTVTACALIFMIAVVLLVSAICKIHMKRTAMRECLHAGTIYLPPPHYSESLSRSPGDNDGTGRTATQAATQAAQPGGSLARLTNVLFHSRYRQVPQPVEMTEVVRPSPQSPGRPTLTSYRSPTFSDAGEYHFSDSDCCGTELNYISPVDFYMPNARGNDRPASTVERILSRLSFNNTYRVNDGFGPSANRAVRPLTLQLGRIQINVPRITRDTNSRRPDTPDIAEVDLDDIDFVRLNSNDTYTLNGRTIRLLGGNFENYPLIGLANDNFVGSVISPPSYSEVAKSYGPPPAYLSRENLLDGAGVTAAPAVSSDSNGNPVQESTSLEMPPRYEEVRGGVLNANHE